jgi:hypothetical protein
MELENQNTNIVDSVNGNIDFKIYLISSSQTNKVYIGSTKQSLEQRLSEHISHAKNTKYKYCKSRVLINEFSDCKIDLIEYTTKEDRLQRERFWVEHYGDRAVNKCLPGRTKKEYNKEYNKEYYQQHAEERKEQMKEYGAVRFICECGTSYRRGDKTRHLRTTKHKERSQSVATQERFITQQ